LGSTLIGHAAAAVSATRPEGAGPANVTLRNSIARNLVPESFPLPTADLFADGGQITADFSSFSTIQAENGATVTTPGSAGNLSGPPGFIDEENGVYVPQNSSPLIDRGDPSVVGSGELDLLGAPRSLDGNRDCIAAPDLGAIEVTGQESACDPPPQLSRVGMTNRVFAPQRRARRSRRARSSRKRKGVKRGTRFLYRLSEPAQVAITIERRSRGRRVRRAGRVRCVKATRRGAKPRCSRFVKVVTLGANEKVGRQSTPFSGLVRGKALKPGRYRATIVATDSAGQDSQPRQVSFRVVHG
jgi:hypothetical protein